ncbi:MAG TPA: electron transfer flavoprotein subunit beta/FixA family protein [Actinomycetota bacterium]|nr:electron transfer flavoprotein subunit beta/FixA family protein [Actinomycetota bacterium]
MNVIVLAKYVPNPNGTPEIGEDFRLKREGVEGALDPGDEYGVEAGLQLADQQGGEVTIVSMGPEVAMGGVRKALSMGAHKAVVVTDDALKGADALATARVLAKAIEKTGFDLVIAGVESTDGYTGTMPMTLAELLGVPCATFARKIELADGTLRVERQTEAGYDVVECPLPAVVTVTAGVNNPRYPTLKGIMQAKQKPVDRLSVSDLGLSADDVEATQEVSGIEAAAAKAAGEIVEDDGSGAARIAQFLQEAKVI